MFTTFSAWVDLLFKAAGHKYIKRIPYSSGGKLRYRYIYKVTHTARGKHALHEDDVTVGAAFMLGTDKGSEVHAHVKSVDGDKVTVEYDDGPRKGEKETMSKRDLLSKLDAAHGISQALQSEREKQAKVVSELRASGASEKQIAREQARLDRLGASVAAPKRPKESTAKPRVTKESKRTDKDLPASVREWVTKYAARMGKLNADSVFPQRIPQPRSAYDQPYALQQRLDKLNADLDSEGVPLRDFIAQHNASTERIVRDFEAMGLWDYLEQVKAAHEKFAREKTEYEGVYDQKLQKIIAFRTACEEVFIHDYRLRSAKEIKAAWPRYIALFKQHFPKVDQYADRLSFDYTKYDPSYPMDHWIFPTSTMMDTATADALLDSPSEPVVDEPPVPAQVAQAISAVRALYGSSDTAKTEVSGPDGLLTQTVRSVIAGLEKVYPDFAPLPIKVELDKRWAYRAGAIERDDHFNITLSALHDTEEIAIHEALHALELYEPTVNRQVLAALASRVSRGGLRPIELTAEHQLKDHFMDEYTAKLYQDSNATEYVTMGGQALLTSTQSAIDFARADPHHFVVTYGLLTGAYK